ncbi:MAG: restriction endonuclease subunit S [Denitrovibrio sp.]|nr:MAG: restriction endonuclease subunit S [Denitrovibrio sp.]
MSPLSFLEKLLDGAEIEWMPLGDVTKINTGQKPSEILDKATDFDYINAGTSRSGYSASSNCEGDTVTTPSRGQGGIGYVGYQKEPFWLGPLCYKMKSIDKKLLINKYLFYFLQSKSELLLGLKKEGGVPAVNKSDLSRLIIPLPCPDEPEKSLKIQGEIVRILDAFTSLTTELTTELTARKKQYNYYRDQLLTFSEDDVDHLPMGLERVGKFIRGGGLQKKDFTETGVGCIHYGQIYTHYGTYTDKTKAFVSEEFAKKARMAQSGDLVIATTSENDEDVCKAVAWLGNDNIAVSSDACFYRHNLNPKYVSYFFQTEQFQKQKRQYITGAKVRRVNADNLAKILIPVPTPEEQARIVAILDKFDMLTNSISEGLPREIELRQKQYEHYRDLLFSFPKPEVDA